MMLNEIMMRGGHQPIVPLEEDPAVSLCYHKKVRVHALPALLFANGYTHFLQRLPERCASYWSAFLGLQVLF